MKNFKQLHLTFAGQIETVLTAADLPVVGIVEGAIRYIEDTDTLTMWDGSAWGGLNFDSLVVNNLTVNNLAYINANVVEIGDNIIVLNNDVTGTPTEDGGVAVNRGDEPDALILWDENKDTWVVGTEGNLSPIPGASPTFTFARPGAVGADTWLLCGSTPSNISGIHNPYTDARIARVFVDSKSPSTYEFELFEHDHSIFTSLGSFSVSSAHGDEFAPNIPITQGKILAVKMKTGSATNVTVGFQLQV